MGEKRKELEAGRKGGEYTKVHRRASPSLGSEEAGRSHGNEGFVLRTAVGPADTVICLIHSYRTVRTTDRISYRALVAPYTITVPEAQTEAVRERKASSSTDLRNGTGVNCSHQQTQGPLHWHWAASSGRIEALGQNSCSQLLSSPSFLFQAPARHPPGRFA
jgi:hypothetical protein